MTFFLKMLAPYLAVAVFWCGGSSGWLALLAYHAQILLWSRASLFEQLRPVSRRQFALVLPALAVGPVVYFMIPRTTHGALPGWLAEHGLASTSFLLMIPYFGLVHPWIEQAHWAPLRERSPIAHFAFAGYHVVVLASLLPWTVLVSIFAVLVLASWLWQAFTRHSRSLLVASVSHVLADLGIVLAAWMRL